MDFTSGAYFRKGLSTQGESCVQQAKFGSQHSSIMRTQVRGGRENPHGEAQRLCIYVEDSAVWD